MDAIIYTKFCLHCIYGERFDNAMEFLKRNKIIPDFHNTQYYPVEHREASKIWGNENYFAFVLYNNKTIDFEAFMKEIENGKELNEIFEDEQKPNKIKFKKKPVRKGKAK